MADDWRPPGIDNPGATPGDSWHPPGIIPGVTQPVQEEAPPSDTPETDAALDEAINKAFPPHPLAPKPDVWGNAWAKATARATEAARAPILPEPMAGGLADVIKASVKEALDPRKAAERAATSLLLPPPLQIMYPQMKGFLQASAQRKPFMEQLGAAVPEVEMTKNLFTLPPGSREWWGRAAIPLGLEALQVAGPVLEGVGALAEIPMARFKTKMAAKPDVVYPEAPAGPALSPEEVAAHQQRYDAAAAQLRAQGGDPVQVARDLAKQQGVTHVRWDHLADAVEHQVGATKPAIISPLREGEMESGSRYNKMLEGYQQTGRAETPHMTTEDWNDARQFARQLQDGDLLEDANGNVWRVASDSHGKHLHGIGPDGDFNGNIVNLYGGIGETGGYNPSGMDTLSLSRRIDSLPPQKTRLSPPSVTPKGTAEDIGRWTQQAVAARQRWEDLALGGEPWTGGIPGGARMPRNLLLPGSETLEQLARGPVRQRPQVPGGRPTPEEAKAEQERFKAASPAHEQRRTLQELEEDVPKPEGPWTEIAPKDVPKVASLQRRLLNKEITQGQYDAELRALQRKPATFRTTPVADSFGSETSPVSKYIMDSGGILSKSGARKLGKLGPGNEALWDDVPSLRHPTHRRIYQESGEMPDIMANNLFNEGLIPDNSVGSMYRAIESESRTARAQTAMEKAGSATEKEVTKQGKAFDAAQKKLSKDPNEPQVIAADLGIGDSVNVDGQDFKVTHIDPDALTVTLEDGKRFGIQDFKHDEIIWGEHEPAPIEGGERSAKRPDQTAGEVPTEQGKPPVSGAAGETETGDPRDAPAEPVAQPERPVAPEAAPPEAAPGRIEGGLSKEQLLRARNFISQMKPGHIFETPEGDRYQVTFSKSNRPLLNRLDENGEFTGTKVKARGPDGLNILARARRLAGEAVEHAKDYPLSPAEPGEGEEPPAGAARPVRPPIKPPSPLTTVFKPPAAKPTGQAQTVMADTIDKAFADLHQKGTIRNPDPGGGLSKQELIDGGHAAISSGVNPLEVAKSDRIPSAQKYAVMRAHGEDLRGEAMRLDDLARKSRDAADKGRAEIAFQKYHNWKVENEKPAELKARQDNPAMEPEVPYDIKNFTDYREHFENANKRKMEPNEIAFGRRLVEEKIKKTDLDLRKAIDDYTKRLGEPQHPIADDDQLRERTAQAFKDMFPCE